MRFMDKEPQASKKNEVSSPTAMVMLEILMKGSRWGPTQLYVEL